MPQRKCHRIQKCRSIRRISNMPSWNLEAFRLSWNPNPFGIVHWKRLGYPLSSQRRRQLWCRVDLDKSGWKLSSFLPQIFSGQRDWVICVCRCVKSMSLILLRCYPWGLRVCPLIDTIRGGRAKFLKLFPGKELSRLKMLGGIVWHVKVQMTAQPQGEFLKLVRHLREEDGRFSRERERETPIAYLARSPSVSKSDCSSQGCMSCLKPFQVKLL